jgi:hypothetical protein
MLETHQLPYKAVIVEFHPAPALQVNRASGFLRREGTELFLYTCWHVVTGIDPNHPIAPSALTRCRLTVRVINKQEINGSWRMGGVREVTIQLYDSSHSPPKPNWLQEWTHVPHAGINALGLKLPRYNDVVKIKLPSEFDIEDDYCVNEFLQPSFLPPGETLLITGFPYGYSALGAGHPFAVVLSRSVAATISTGNALRMLLDGMGAPGMSGGPVFAIAEGRPYLLGIYTGCIFPDAELGGSRFMSTALGVVNNLYLLLRHDQEAAVRMVATDDVCFIAEN